jgi:hypothetical protein
VKGQLFVTQLALLLEQRTAQHTLRRQSPPAGLAHPLPAHITRHQLTNAGWPSSHCDIAFNSQPISCCANTSNIVAWTVRSRRIVGSGGQGR